MQINLENDKMRLEAREGGEGRDIKVILPGWLVLKKPWERTPAGTPTRGCPSEQDPQLPLVPKQGRLRTEN